MSASREEVKKKLYSKVDEVEEDWRLTYDNVGFFKRKLKRSSSAE